LAKDIRFYLDENVEVEIAEQLKTHGIEVVTVRELKSLGASDEHHLVTATKMGYVLCTYDMDYLRLASEGFEHAGIVFGRWSKHGIGRWVTALTFIYHNLDAENMKNHVEYISSK